MTQPADGSGARGIVWRPGPQSRRPRVIPQPSTSPSSPRSPDAKRRSSTRCWCCGQGRHGERWNDAASWASCSTTSPPWPDCCRPMTPSATASRSESADLCNASSSFCPELFPALLFVQACLDEEQRREQLRASMLCWSDLLDPDDLSMLRDALIEPDSSGSAPDPGRIARRAVELLATLYQARNRAEREQRAHDRVRDARLQWVTRWLLLLLASAAALLVVAFSLAASSRVDWLQDAVSI